MFARDHIEYQPADLPDRMDYSAEKSLSEAKTFYDRMKRRLSVVRVFGTNGGLN